MFADKVALLREGQDEMQKQSRLQQPRGDVAPIDRPVKLVQLLLRQPEVNHER
jgi:hypothetical protein